MLTEYNHDANVTKMIDHYDWYILPVFNADGYEYSHTTVSRQLPKILTIKQYVIFVS